MNKTKKLPLTQGQFALIDAEDYEELIKHNWQFSSFINGVKVSRHIKGTRSNLDLGRDLLNPPKRFCVVPKNGDPLDFRKKNLKICRGSFRTQHARLWGIPKTSKFKGVSWNKRRLKWGTSIYKNGKTHFLGYFNNEEEAAKTYDAKARELYGESAYQNFNNPVRPQRKLRLFATPRQNRRHSDSISKYKGVTYISKGKRRWLAQIYYNRNIISLGRFYTEIEAAKVYDRKSKELFGKSAYLNFP